jgi:hypothetical protein
MAQPAAIEKAVEVRVVALCGESLLIEGIEAILQAREGVEVELLDTSRPGAFQALDKLNPDIIVYDLTQAQLSSVLTFLRTHTDVVLIGLAMNSDLALFVSAEWRRLPSVADLMQVIDARIRAKKGGDSEESDMCSDTRDQQPAPLP